MASVVNSRTSVAYSVMTDSSSSSRKLTFVGRFPLLTLALIGCGLASNTGSTLNVFGAAVIVQHWNPAAAHKELIDMLF